MYKIMFAAAILSSSVASYAQWGTDDSSNESRVETTAPGTKAMETSARKWSIGVNSGINSPKGDQGSSTQYGFITGFEPNKTLGMGIEVSSTHLDDTNEVRQTNALLRTTYNFGGDTPIIRDSFIGAGAGPVFIGNRVRAAGAPLAGFDIPLNHKTSDYVSLGLEAKYLFVLNTDVPDLFSSAVAVKYWF